MKKSIDAEVLWITEEKVLKHIFNSIWIFVSIFIICYFLIGGFVIALFSFFYEFGVINRTETESLLFSLMVTAITALIITMVFFLLIGKRKKTKLGNWFSMNIAMLYFVYIVVCFVLYSLKKEVVWDYQEVKEIVNLQWTIFGLTITIYSVWQVIITHYLESKKPIPNAKKDLYSLSHELNKKVAFHQRITWTFGVLNQILVNLFILLMITIAIYSFKKDMLLNWYQNVIRFNLWFSLFTLYRTFLDATKPIRDDKKRLLENAKISSEEISEHNRIEEKIEKTMVVLNHIDELDILDEAEKEKIKKELLIKTFGSEDFIEKRIKELQSR